MAPGSQNPASLRVVVLGGGAIGLGLASTVLSAGGGVDLVEPDDSARAAAGSGIEAHLADIRTAGHPVRDDGAALSRLRVYPALGDAAPDPSLVLEAAPERLSLKRSLFAGILRWAGGDTPVATTSSALTVSEIVDQPEDQAQCLNAHCFNPPSVLRAIECVPGPGTRPETTETATRILGTLGFEPVLLSHAIPAFVGNRLQGAVLREAYRLVDAGVVDVEGLDRLVRETLGPRWALSGPFETAELNTPGGIRGHAARMGPAYGAIGEALGEREPYWSGALVERVEAERRALLPESGIPARAAWRRRALARLTAARRAILADAPEPEEE